MNIDVPELCCEARFVIIDNSYCLPIVTKDLEVFFWIKTDHFEKCRCYDHGTFESSSMSPLADV